MFVNMNMKTFNLSNFQNICRVCMSEENLETLQEGHMKTLHLVSKVQISRKDELPQKICESCVRRLNDIMALALLCKRIDQTLKKYLENLKLENLEIKLPEPIKTEEITIVEEKIEFIDVNEQIDLETNYVKKELEKIKEELIQAEKNQNTPLYAASPRPFKCKHCDRWFSLRSTMHAHVRYTHKDLTRFRCEICGKGFPLQAALIKHKIVHKPAYCGRCKQSFMNQENLRMHQQLHEREKPYECLICFKSFNFLKSYLKHNQVHGSNNRFNCDQCEASFAAQGSLARHKRVHKRKKNTNKKKCDSKNKKK